MPHHICTACGTQFPERDAPPGRCAICDDERQFVPAAGQGWTTLERLRLTHRNTFHRLEPDLYAIRSAPAFAIGQRALLVRSPGGNVLWDCITLLDDATVDVIRALGGLAAIAISHPHYYSTHVEWSGALGGVPVYLHADDRAWVMRPSDVVRFWEGETLALHDGLALARCGGHFDGATVLHWPAGADGRGALLVGDVLQVLPDRRHVSVMYSYPNLIPVGAGTLERVAAAIEPLAYELVSGAFDGREITDDGKGAVARSMERYRARVES
jgi:hypothetical protein